MIRRNFYHMKNILSYTLLIFPLTYGCAGFNWESPVVTHTRAEEFHEKTRRESYISNHPELTEDQKSGILSGKIWIGMDEAGVIASLGHPAHKTTSISQFGKSETWTYGECLYGCSILSIFNGKLTNITSTD